MISSTALTKTTGATFRQIDVWTRRGYLIADQEQPGTGYYRQYADTEIDVARALLTLTRHGLLNTKSAQTIAEHVRAYGLGDMITLDGVSIRIHPIPTKEKK